MATRAQVTEFREANRSLVLLAQRDLRDFWGSLNLLGDPTRVRRATTAFFPELITAYGDAAALLGADFYDSLRNVPPSAARFRATLAAAPPAEQAEGSARWALGSLFLDEPDTDSALAKLVGATQRLVLQPGRETIFSSAWSDPVATGVARVPSGPTTCQFCIMLASRGPVYRSEVSAELVVGRGSNRTGYDASGRRLAGGIGGGVKARGNQAIASSFHDNCDCVPTVIRDTSDYPEDYDLDLYKKLYSEGSGLGRDIPTTD